MIRSSPPGFGAGDRRSPGSRAVPSGPFRARDLFNTAGATCRQALPIGSSYRTITLAVPSRRESGWPGRSRAPGLAVDLHLRRHAWGHVPWTSSVRRRADAANRISRSSNRLVSLADQARVSARSTVVPGKAGLRANASALREQVVALESRSLCTSSAVCLRQASAEASKRQAGIRQAPVHGILRATGPGPRAECGLPCEEAVQDAVRRRRAAGHCRRLRMLMLSSTVPSGR